MKRVLVVGAGCTGSCVAAYLRRLLEKSVSIEVWEWSRGVGGRMTSTRHESTSETLRADTGASLISVDMSDAASATLMEGILEAGILRQVDPQLLSRTPLRPSGGSWQHFASIGGGLNSALKFLLEQAEVATSFERRVASIDLQGGLWKVRPYEGPADLFDAVVIAVEACGDGTDHVHQIRGGWQRLIDPGIDRQLRTQLYDHRFGVALFLKPEYREHCEEFFGPTALEKQLDDDMTHLMQYQSRKTVAIGGLESEGLVVVAHCTVEFSNRDLGYGKNRRLELITNRIIHQYLRVPGRTKINDVILGSKVINWRTCEVMKPVIQPSAACPKCWLVNREPTLVLAGDYFTQSNFTGCAASAADAAQAVAAALKGDCSVQRSSSSADADTPADTVPHRVVSVDPGKDPASDAPSRRWAAKRFGEASGAAEQMSELPEACSLDFEDRSASAQKHGRWRRKGAGKGKGSKGYKE